MIKNVMVISTAEEKLLPLLIIVLLALVLLALLTTNDWQLSELHRDLGFAFVVDDGRGITGIGELILHAVQ
jgi:hypothetical protein